MDFLGLDKIKANLQETQRELLVTLGNQAQNYFVSSWRKQGFDGKPWKEVQRREPGKAAYKYPKTKGFGRRTNPILIGAGYSIGKGATSKGGTLRRAVSNMMRTAEIGKGRLKMVVDVPYAGYLNEGTDNMVKRQFVGQTPELTQMQEKKIKQIYDKMFKA